MSASSGGSLKRNVYTEFKEVKKEKATNLAGDPVYDIQFYLKTESNDEVLAACGELQTDGTYIYRSSLGPQHPFVNTDRDELTKWLEDTIKQSKATTSPQTEAAPVSQSPPTTLQPSSTVPGIVSVPTAPTAVASTAAYSLPSVSTVVPELNFVRPDVRPALMAAAQNLLARVSPHMLHQQGPIMTPALMAQTHPLAYLAAQHYSAALAHPIQPSFTNPVAAAPPAQIVEPEPARANVPIVLGSGTTAATADTTREFVKVRVAKEKRSGEPGNRSFRRWYLIDTNGKEHLAVDTTKLDSSGKFTYESVGRFAKEDPMISKSQNVVNNWLAKYVTDGKGNLSSAPSSNPGTNDGATHVTSTAANQGTPPVLSYSQCDRTISALADAIQRAQKATSTAAGPSSTAAAAPTPHNNSPKNKSKDPLPTPMTLKEQMFVHDTVKRNQIMEARLQKVSEEMLWLNAQCGVEYTISVVTYERQLRVLTSTQVEIQAPQIAHEKKSLPGSSSPVKGSHRGTSVDQEDISASRSRGAAPAAEPRPDPSTSTLKHPPRINTTTKAAAASTRPPPSSSKPHPPSTKPSASRPSTTKPSSMATKPPTGKPPSTSAKPQSAAATRTPPIPGSMKRKPVPQSPPSPGTKIAGLRKKRKVVSVYAEPPAAVSKKKRTVLVKAEKRRDASNKASSKVEAPGLHHLGSIAERELLTIRDPDLKAMVSNVKNNEEPYVQGVWKRQPFPQLPFQSIDRFEIAGDAGEAVDVAALNSKLQTSIPSSDATEWCEADLSQPLVVLTSLPQPLNDRDVEVRTVWGLDKFSRRTIHDALERCKNVFSNGSKEEITRLQDEFIPSKLLPAINSVGDKGWDLGAALSYLKKQSAGQPDGSTTVRIVEELQRIMELTERNPWGKKVVNRKPEEREFFRVHPKGEGVICINEEGIKAGRFVQEYFGELYCPWRWFEKTDMTRQPTAQMKGYNWKRHKITKMGNTPELYNITLERPKADTHGYDIIFVDAVNKGNFTSRMSHSCDPNCKVINCVVDGRLTISIFTLRDIAPGEELTLDYACETENHKEYDKAVCLCGARSCRGSFMYLVDYNSPTRQQVLLHHHTFLQRSAIILLSTSGQLTATEEERLARNGVLGCLLMDGAPDSGTPLPGWLRKWTALVLGFIEFERDELVQVLQRTQNEDGFYTLEDAEAEAEDVMQNRLQNLAFTLDKCKLFLRHQTPEMREVPPLRLLDEEEVMDHLWNDSESVAARAVNTVLQYCKSQEAETLVLGREQRRPLAVANTMSHHGSPASTPQHSMHSTALRGGEQAEVTTSGQILGGKLEQLYNDNDATSASHARELLARMADMVRGYGASHAALHDVLMLNAGTSTFCAPAMYETFSSDVSEVKYRGQFLWALLSCWFKQYSDPQVSLRQDRRGCLSVPDPECVYLPNFASGRYVREGERAALLEQIQQHPSEAWPNLSSWSFRNVAKIYGSPMFDAVLAEEAKQLAKPEPMEVEHREQQPTEMVEEPADQGANNTMLVEAAEEAGANDTTLVEAAEEAGANNTTLVEAAEEAGANDNRAETETNRTASEAPEQPSSPQPGDEFMVDVSSPQPGDEFLVDASETLPEMMDVGRAATAEAVPREDAEKALGGGEPGTAAKETKPEAGGNATATETAGKNAAEIEVEAGGKAAETETEADEDTAAAMETGAGEKAAATEQEAGGRAGAEMGAEAAEKATATEPETGEKAGAEIGAEAAGKAAATEPEASVNAEAAVKSGAGTMEEGASALMNAAALLGGSPGGQPATTSTVQQAAQSAELQQFVGSLKSAFH